MTDPTTNGMITPLREKVTALELRNTELETEKRNLGPELRRFQRALELLTDENAYKPLGPSYSPGKPKTKKKKIRKVAGRTLEEFKLAISTYTETHGDEFSQVDIRTELGGNISTSQSALAFEQLRQENFIRFARMDGKRKIFRLTREAVRANG